jgi:small-conductance mechanosensitive channel
VGYDSDVNLVRDLLLQAGTAHPDVLPEPKPIVVFIDYGDNSLDFELWVWTASRAHAPKLLKSDLYFTLFDMFKEHGIELPFPQRDLHLRSSDIAIPGTAAPMNPVNEDVVR